jgi:vacuolar-type H+-ATPase subunit I/STV1
VIDQAGFGHPARPIPQEIIPMQPLFVLAQPFKLSKKTAALQRSLNERIESLNARIETHNAAAAAIAGLETSAALLASADRADELRRERLTLLSDEFKLRQELIDYFNACQADKSTAITAACDEEAAAFEEVSAKLVEAGFELIDHPTFGRSVPRQVLLLHPRIREVTGNVRALQAFDYTHEQLNRERIENIHQEASALRTKAAATAAA